MTSQYHYQELENWLLRGISEHRWRLGERLPSIRTLCIERNLSEATVQNALQRLEAQGLVEARSKTGYFVTLPPTHIKRSLNAGQVEALRPVTVSDLFLDIMKRSAAFDLLPDPGSGRLSPRNSEFESFNWQSSAASTRRASPILRYAGVRSSFS